MEDAAISVEYFYPQFRQSTPGVTGNQRDARANAMASEWIAKGLLMTDQVIKSGTDLLGVVSNF